MIKMIIADDEAIIRKGLRHHIDWNKHDVSVIDETSNGKEALQLALSLRPDIIIADISMPVMTGLELAKELKQLMPDIYIILLSGYNDKEYLMQAIKLGVDDYVMKTANPMDILDAVLKAKERIIEQRSLKESNTSSSKVIEQNYLAIRKAFLENLFDNKLSKTAMQSRTSSLDIDLSGPKYILFKLLLNPIEDQSLQMSVLFHFHKYKPFIVQNEPDCLVTILNINESFNFDNIKKDFYSLSNYFKENEIKVKTYVSEVISDLNELSLANKNVNILIEQSCWDSDFDVIFFNKYHKEETLSLEMQLQLEKELAESFSMRNKSKFEEKLDQFQCIMQNYRLPFTHLQESAKRIIAAMLSIADYYDNAGDLIEKIESTENIDKIFLLILEVMQSYSETTAKSSVVECALEYIQKHYNEPIKLSDIAAKCYISPSYLSKIFIDEMNIGVVKYIHNLRIEKAKKTLLSTDKRVSDIAMDVGYPNYKQFSAYFLKIAGVNPSKYRAINLN